MKIPKKKVLVICDYFLPGTKSGGGMWTILNLVRRFYDRFDFFIVTRNHDGPADRAPYPGIQTDIWVADHNAQILYLDARAISQQSIINTLQHVQPDVVFLNSVFSILSIRFLFARLRNAFDDIPVIIAPTGELSAGALSIKKLKKRFFLFVAKVFGLYRDVIWKASFDPEVKEIQRHFGEKVPVLKAPDLPPKSILPDFDVSRKPSKTPGEARLIFASRISRKKNLKYLLDRLAQVQKGKIILQIAGPIEDAAYWKECARAISHLPKNIETEYLGALSNNEVLQHLCNNHFFVLPTLNENFGYVFLEALAAGCLVLTSDRVPWTDMASNGVGWLTELENPKSWVDKIQSCIDMSEAEFRHLSEKAQTLAQTWINDPVIEAATYNVVEIAIKR